MAKKVSSFAADFEGISKSADDKVFAMLRQAENKSEASPKPPPVVKAEKSSAKPTREAAAGASKTEAVKSEKKKVTKPKLPVEWGKPVAHFNTRIPEKMAELLDDLVYMLRKKGDAKTKQDLAQEALRGLLAKYGMC